MGQGVCDVQGIARKPHICCVPAPRAPSLCRGSSGLGKAQLKKEPCLSAGLRRGDATGRGNGDCPAAETAANGVLSITSKGPCASAPDAVREASKSAASEVKLHQKRQPVNRLRRAFTDEQHRKLENAFRKQTYLDWLDRRGLAAELHLTEEQVQTWFQNRRVKLKRQQQDMEVKRQQQDIKLKQRPQDMKFKQQPQDMKLKQQPQDYSRCLWPTFPLCMLCHPKTPASQIDESAMYSPQSIPPFMPNPALWFNLSGCKYQPFQNPPCLPYHLLPQASGNSNEEGKVESKQTFPSPTFGYGML